MHLTEDELVLHYYGELEREAEGRATAHLGACAACHAGYTRLQRVLAAVDAAPALEPPAGFERTVWARLEPTLARRRGGFFWFVASPARLAWAAAIVVLVGASFVAGRLYRGTDDGGATASPAQVRERILLVDLGNHLDRSQMVLVEIASADADAGADLTLERERAVQLVKDNRLYRQTARQAGDRSIVDLLDDLERVLVEVAAAPADAPADDLGAVQRRIDARDLLFKLRVMSAEVRDRQRPGNKTT
jgi:hypothetical protein